MFSFNRKERFVLLGLTAALLIGGAVNLVERYSGSDLPDFHIQKGAVPVPGKSKKTGSIEQHAGPIDLNRASAGQLTRLPGIGPKIARRIVDDRNQRGPFKSVDELTRVKGIGRKTLQRLGSKITVGGQ
ncbi:MAG: helix-hairpin-helix domain-containing protein [Gemmatimonadetes bacterium]|nr:helix-hairpin-helix domain-containing protein [Gemmatimonadota bacterium]MDE3256722.1 helix-hairpin-helix domain-containing protein [Gemmatimonadota bacterium]